MFTSGRNHNKRNSPSYKLPNLNNLAPRLLTQQVHPMGMYPHFLLEGSNSSLTFYQSQAVLISAWTPWPPSFPFRGIPDMCGGSSSPLLRPPSVTVTQHYLQGRADRASTNQWFSITEGEQSHSRAVDITVYAESQPALRRKQNTFW